MLAPERIADGISRIPAKEEPLSADVWLIEGERFLWAYDIGSLPENAEYLNMQAKPVCCVLSHFHPDHTAAITKLNAEKIYLSGNTAKYVGFGEVVNEDIWFDDFPGLHIFLLPSSHAKGSLGLEAGDYAFIGDALCPGFKAGRAAYNAGVLADEIKVLRSLRAEFLVVSHEPRFALRRAEAIAELEEIYSRRGKNEAYIAVV